MVLALVTVPFVLPTVVVGAAFLALLPASLDQTVWAILIAHVYFNLAVVIRTRRHAVGPARPPRGGGRPHARRLAAAGPAGGSRSRCCDPRCVAAASITFLFTFTSFGVIRILGGPRHPTIEVEIWRLTTQAFDLPAAAALAFLQLLAVTGLMIWWSRAQARQAVTLRLRPGGPRPWRPGRPGSATLVTVHGGRAGRGRRSCPSCRLVAGSLHARPTATAWRHGGHWAEPAGPAPPAARSPTRWPSVGTSLRFAVVATALAVAHRWCRGMRHRLRRAGAATCSTPV